jgi:agmatine deiminase
VDEVASFIAPGRVLILESSDPADPNTATLAENRAILKAAGLDVLTVPQPTLRRDGPNGRVTTSYANFYIANGGVIVPAYDDPMDREAEAVFRAAFPYHEVVMVPSLGVAAGGGNIHCVTQQEPR